MLELNSSFLWIFFLLWLLYLVLNRIFFKPVGKIITERETKIITDSNRLESLLTEIENKTCAIESRLEQARQEARHIKEEWLMNGENIRSRTVAEAREQAARVLEQKIAQLESELIVAERTLEAQVSVFSDKIKQVYL